MLSTIYDVLKDESKKEPLILSNAQIKAIKIAEGEIKGGKFLSDAEVKKRTKAWLGKYLDKFISPY